MAHSYSGIVARAFLTSVPPGAVTGMVLIDTGRELTYALFPHLPPASFEAVGAGVDLAEETQLARDSHLTEA
ncbi:hypothetical protein LTS02_018087, partial [Friedmanniomyces endolithicus]